jgi:gluconokinase
MNQFIIMGVAGCGKSAVGAQVAAELNCPLIEGDDHHSQANIVKMRNGAPLTDADRADWLTELGAILAAYQGASVVLTCSALRRVYRDQLRAAAPGVQFVWLRISPELALARVTQRAGAHLFPPTLVASQFATLESPLGEAGVIEVDAALPLISIKTCVLTHIKDTA